MHRMLAAFNGDDVEAVLATFDENCSISEPPEMPDTPLLIAGLGNPGAEYARNRHNAGFIAVDTIHESYKFGPWKARFQGAISEGTINGRKVYLLKPGTYMNESGNSIGSGYVSWLRQSSRRWYAVL